MRKPDADYANVLSARKPDEDDAKAAHESYDFGVVADVGVADPDVDANIDDDTGDDGDADADADAADDADDGDTDADNVADDYDDADADYDDVVDAASYGKTVCLLVLLLWR